MTPAGKPASITSSPSFKAVKGVSSEGFNNTVLPVASAGASLRLAIARGAFQGMMEPTTPILREHTALNAQRITTVLVTHGSALVYATLLSFTCDRRKEVESVKSTPPKQQMADRTFYSFSVNFVCPPTVVP